MAYLTEQKHPICILRVKMCICSGPTNSGQYAQTLGKPYVDGLQKNCSRLKNS